MTRDYISISEAAEYLKVSDRTVRRLIADGELTGYRIGKSGRLIRVDRNEIDQNLMRLMGGTVWRDTTPTTPQQTSRRQQPTYQSLIRLPARNPAFGGLRPGAPAPHR
jgi:excisionase family DNA binding protein